MFTHNTDHELIARIINYSLLKGLQIITSQLKEKMPSLRARSFGPTEVTCLSEARWRADSFWFPLRCIQWERQQRLHCHSRPRAVRGNFTRSRRSHEEGGWRFSPPVLTDAGTIGCL